MEPQVTEFARQQFIQVLVLLQSFAQEYMNLSFENLMSAL